MSEVDFLIKQLEYCFNSKSQIPLPKILYNLIRFKGQVSVSYRMHFDCTSHMTFFGSNASFENTANILLFYPCNHIVCKSCIVEYIQPIYIRSGTNNMYYCPGCVSERSPSASPIMQIQYYIQQLISPEIIMEVEARNLQTLLTYNARQMTIKVSRCYFAENPGNIRCKGTSKVQKVIGCNHLICYDCVLIYLRENIDSNEIRCMAKGCLKFISHSFIKVALAKDPEMRSKFWKKLRITGEVQLICPSCPSSFITASSSQSTCRCPCGVELCTECGSISHADIPCLVALSKQDEYQEFVCENNEHYEFARSQFEWNLHEAQKQKLVGAAGLKVKSVTLVYNPLLQEKFEKAKQEMIKDGIDPGEIFVYHGSNIKNYPDICRKGILIGGKDVKIAIGSVYGFGVYTASDATMSIHFANKNGKLLLCKGLVGRISPNPIKKIEDLSKTNYHSYFADFRGVQSNYYIFFKSDYVIPYYIIEYN